MRCGSGETPRAFGFSFPLFFNGERACHPERSARQRA